VTNSAGRTPEKLCGIYEFADSAGVLDTIARSKGTNALPQSDDQGAMVWRLFETVARRPPVTLPAGVGLAVALVQSAHKPADLALLLKAADGTIARGATYARPLRLSPSQPPKGSEYNVGLIVAFHHQAKAIEMLNAQRLRTGFSRLVQNATLLPRHSCFPRHRSS
jgi:hypothetical protein